MLILMLILILIVVYHRQVNVGGLLERLWRAAAIEHLVDIATKADPGALRQVFSLGPKLNTKISFMKALDDYTMPSRAHALCDFQFNADLGAADDAHDAPEPPEDWTTTWTDQKVLFFEIHSRRPGQHKVPLMAPKVPLDAIGIRRLHPASVDTVTHEVHLHLETSSGHAGADLHALTPSLLSTIDLNHIRRWDRSLRLKYSFDIDFVPELEEAFSALAPRMCAKDNDGNYASVTIMDSSDPTFSQRTVMQRLESYEVVTQISMDIVSTTWQLVEEGERRLRVSQPIQHDGRMALETRPGIQALDATTLELLSMMADWNFNVKVKRGRKAGGDADGRLDCCDYKLGEAKHAWVRPDAEAHGQWYLRALLLARPGQNVPHYKSEGYYQALVEGRPVPQGKKPPFVLIPMGHRPNAANALPRRSSIV